MRPRRLLLLLLPLLLLLLLQLVLIIRHHLIPHQILYLLSAYFPLLLGCTYQLRQKHLWRR